MFPATQSELIFCLASLLMELGLDQHVQFSPFQLLIFDPPALVPLFSLSSLSLP